MLTVLVPFLFLMLSMNTVSTDESLQICIGEAVAKECPGFYGKYSRNHRLLKIDPNKLQVVDGETGLETRSIRLPGKYILHFSDLEIVGLEPLDFLVGDLRVQLVDVPLFGSIQAVPSVVPTVNNPRSWLSGNFVKYCDGQSHKVDVDGSYCRYCDLCHVATLVETNLITGHHKVLPNLVNEGPFGLNCTKFYPGRKYNLRRSIDLAAPRQAKLRLPTLNGNLQGAFKQGEGTMQVNLRLLHKKCTSSSWCSGPHCDTCNSETSRAQCLNTNGFEGSYELAACYNIEFKYRVATDDQRAGLLACPPQNRQPAPGTLTHRALAPTFQQDDRCPLWCCNRPIAFVRSFNCPTDCVFRPVEACGFPSLRPT